MTSAGTVVGERRRLVAAAAALFADSGLESPRLDAEILLAHALGIPRLDLLLRPTAAVPPAVRRRFAAFVRARTRHEPVAYLVGSREFYGRAFAVDRRVLVPRPETESLAAAAISWLGSRPSGRRRVLDLCTGSGCLAITIAVEAEGAEVLATDLSRDALDVARSNAEKLSARRISFADGDLFDAVPVGRKFDLIVSNPPYVTTSELSSVDRSVKEHEPRAAWFSGEDPLLFHRRIVDGASNWIERDGALMLEVGSGSAELLGVAGGQFARSRASILDDLGGRPRVVVVELGPSRSV